MKGRSAVGYLTLVWCVALQGWTQTPVASSDNPTSRRAAPSGASLKNEASMNLPRLRREPMVSTKEIADSFGLPVVCDDDGNLYVRTDPDGVQALHKLNSKGQRIALFQATSPTVKVDAAGSFAVTPDGDLYQLIFAREINRYVFVFARNGPLKSEIKLQPGFPFSPSKIAVFPNGDLLITGLKYDQDRNNKTKWPFTGIFAPDGTLRRELSLKDDQLIHDMAVGGDPTVVPPETPSVNYAIARGDAQAAADGNIYVMRRLPKPIFYAISPGGSVRRFEVDPGHDDFVPESMHVSGTRIAVMFWQPQTYEQIIKVVDLRGRSQAAYYEPAAKEGEQPLGLGFACYTQTPERFTFLEATDDDRLALIAAIP